MQKNTLKCKTWSEASSDLRAYTYLHKSAGLCVHMHLYVCVCAYGHTRMCMCKEREGEVRKDLLAINLSSTP